MNLDDGGRLIVGEQVEVRAQFNRSWSDGFEIAEVLTSGYRVRRTNDGAMLPDPTSHDDVRSARTASPWARSARIGER